MENNLECKGEIHNMSALYQTRKNIITKALNIDEIGYVCNILFMLWKL